MHDRCYNPDVKSYQWYGKRGIKVSPEWFEFLNFYKSMGFPPSSKHSLGRINNDKDYGPSNCRWELPEEQNNNTKRSKYITWRGQTKTLRSWAEEYDVNPKNLSDRLKRGWDLKRALETKTPLSFKDAVQLKRESQKVQWNKMGSVYSARSDFRSNQKMTSRRIELLNKNGYEPSSKKSPILDNSELTQKIFQLRNDGFTYREIAKKLNVSKSSVSNVINFYK